LLDSILKDKDNKKNKAYNTVILHLRLGDVLNTKLYNNNNFKYIKVGNLTPTQIFNNDNNQNRYIKTKNII